MDWKFFWVSIVAIIISFAGGFLIANAINRGKINDLTSENGRLKKENVRLSSGKTNPSLSKELILEKLGEAEANKGNFTFQKNLGLALYRYSTMTRDTKLLADVRKLLARANELNTDDYEVLVSLGNVHFDIGRSENKQESLEEARGYYLKALGKNSQDINVRTDYGWTYLFAEPPETDKAIAEFERSLAINSKHEKSLQLMVEALIKQGQKPEANRYLVKLRGVNPQNAELSKFEKEIDRVNK